MTPSGRQLAAVIDINIQYNNSLNQKEKPRKYLSIESTIVPVNNILHTSGSSIHI